MQVKLIRGIKDGRDFIEFWGDTVAYGRSPIGISRSLTGTTDEQDIGIFFTARSVWFRYGAYYKEFLFDDSLSLKSDNLRDLKRKLENRIRIVKEWVNSIDKTETLEFNL
jgi:hypothetical protein